MRKRLALLLLGGWLVTLRAATVVFIGAAGDSDLFSEAFRDLGLPPAIVFEHRCAGVDSEALLLDAVKRADVLILNARSADVRSLAPHADLSKTRLYALSSRLLPKEIPAQEPPEVIRYRENRRPENFRNMVRWIVCRELDPAVTFEPPLTLPEIGATHPAAGRVFDSLAAYRRWAKTSGHFAPDAGLIAFAVHAASINPAELALFRPLIDECEKQGLNAVIVYGDEPKVIRRLLLDAGGRSQVDAVLALSFKFKAGLGEELRTAIRDLDVPIFNALRLYRQTTPEWAESVRGMNDFSVAFAFIAPEISGLIEPSLLFGTRVETDAEGRRIQVPEAFPEAISNTVARLKKWVGLRRKPAAEKRVALFLYNGAGGKQNIGASYLNVPRSLVHILRALAGAGYRTGGLEALDEAALTAELLRSARNVGPWAPGELDDLIAHGEVVRLPKRQYAAWFAELPEGFRRSVIAEWGPPEQAKAMVSGSDFILPMLKRGNLTILPEPMRGWLGDPHKLVHAATLAPPHQYLAVYLWLRHAFRADAMIHLGRHGSSEWLPGKQLGLSPADAPMIVRGDIPEIYPYISDGIGEAVVAKRRAQAVMIDHLPPFLQIPPSDGFLPELKQRIAACQSADPAVREERETALRAFARAHGLAERLALDAPDWFEKVEEYAESRTAPAPFGLHAFGVSPTEREAETMLAELPETERAAAAEPLRNAGSDELRALLHALAGGFVEPGPSGDPLRNPKMLPVGRNFYSFDPAKVPSPEAMKKGAKLAADLLAREQARLGRLPRTVAVVLWAGESVRTDGANEALALALMGMSLRYDRTGRVSGVVPVPGAQLGRPRIDVLITTSGAYRDQFGDLLRLLNEARRQAARLDDAENFIRRDTPGVFFPAPGTYGTRVNRLAGASGLWEKEEELAAVYLRNMAHTLDAKGNFTEDRAGLEAALPAVDAVLHSRSGNVYGVTDLDDMYQYLGGLALAVRSRSGRAPDTFIADRRRREGERLADLKSFLGAELDSRLFHPAWIRAMMREEYAGAKMLARTADNLWGWQAVTPENLTAADWTNLYEIYVQDRYQLGMKEFFSGSREWAFQSMTGRMLEAVRKGYWEAPMPVRRALAAEYAKSVIRQGMACCDHTCNNPLLNQMVLNLISLPGVLSPEMAMKFRVAVEKSGGQKLEDLVRERRELQRELAESFGSNARRAARPAETAEPKREAASPHPEEQVPVKGYRMQEETRSETTELASSGLKWTILITVFALIGVFAWGTLRRER